MRSKRLVWVGLVTLLVGLTGCPCLLTDLQLDEHDNGSGVITRVGKQIVVTLSSNASTGYAWELAELDTTVLENTDQSYEPPTSGLTGAPGTERWVFVARSAGSTTLRLEYRRPGDAPEGEPADSFQVRVLVLANE